MWETCIVSAGIPHQTLPPRQGVPHLLNQRVRTPISTQPQQVTFRCRRVWKPVPKTRQSQQQPCRSCHGRQPGGARSTAMGTGPLPPACSSKTHREGSTAHVAFHLLPRACPPAPLTSLQVWCLFLLSLPKPRSPHDSQSSLFKHKSQRTRNQLSQGWPTPFWTAQESSTVFLQGTWKFTFLLPHPFLRRRLAQLPSLLFDGVEGESPTVREAVAPSTPTCREPGLSNRTAWETICSDSEVWGHHATSGSSKTRDPPRPPF